MPHILGLGIDCLVKLMPLVLRQLTGTNLQEWFDNRAICLINSEDKILSSV